MRIKAKKSLGQNFLRDPKILEQIINAGDIKATDCIVEIGPGKGALTEYLLQKSQDVIAVEIDGRLISHLNSKFADQSNFQLIYGNALEYNPPKKPYKIIANIPYYITSPLLTHFLLEQFEQDNLPETIVLLIQKEVAEKICNPKRNSVIALAVKLFGSPELVCKVSPKAFIPEPKVSSAVIKISNIKAPNTKDPRKLMKFIKHCFLNPRKTINNNLKQLTKEHAGTILEKTQIAPDTRPEQIPTEKWHELHEAYQNAIR